MGAVTGGADPRLRFRMWVDGRLVDEMWVDAGNPDAERITDAARDRHQAMAARADRDDLVWLVEVFDPGELPERAYVRMGTDRAGMVAPEPLCGCVCSSGGRCGGCGRAGC